MNPQHKQWFDALTQDRTENANTLEKPSMRGVQRSVVDKYSDQAHFIYELLQNADDVGATWASFALTDDGLVFTHNGEIRFSISDPASEEADSEKGTLGHVNSITSIANSNKTAASIGKFGVGFKAVFQYTKTPHIYDPGFHFKIERFLVPRALEVDFPSRKPAETVFWFPFDDERKPAIDCRSEIAEKLRTLVFPTLFLSKLEAVSWTMEGMSGRYTKRVIRKVKRPDLTASLISLASERDRGTSKQRMWLFSRGSAEELPHCIGYAIDRGKVSPTSQPAFCFFPTKETTGLNFIIHAPFLLTDSREGIKAGEKHNLAMVEHLAQLAADSLFVLRDERLIDDGILEIVPYDDTVFGEPSDMSRISFKPFFTAIKETLRNNTLLPAANGECSARSRLYWASDTELVDLFSDKQIAQLTGTKDARWVFRSLGKKSTEKNPALADYIDGGDTRSWNRKEPNLIVASLDPEAVLRKITADFIGGQTQGWLHRLYAYLSERESYRKVVKDKAIFLDEDGNAVPAFDSSGQRILFLPDDDIDGYTTIKKALLSNKNTREFVEKFGIKKPSLHDEIYNKILPEYVTDTDIDTTPHFGKFFRYFKECKNEDVGAFVRLIADKEFLKYATAGDDTVYRGRGHDIYLPTDDLKAWFEPKPDTRFLLLDEYRDAVGEKDWGRLDDFLARLGVERSPRILSSSSPVSWSELRRRGWTTEGHSHEFEDKAIDGSKELVQGINPDRSLLLWKLVQNRTHLLDGVHSWFRYNPRAESSRVFRRANSLRGLAYGKTAEVFT